MAKRQFKQGVTSIYVVIVAMLLFSVITVSFIRIIISEMNRTTSDELAQSAYDSALAGIEDAKTALKQYYRCLQDPSISNCDRVRTSIEKGFASSRSNDPSYCDAISEALGRISEDADTEVYINERRDNEAGKTYQAYTCVMINDKLTDYRYTLTMTNPTHIVPIKVDPAIINDVTGFRVFWYTESDGPFANLTIDKTSYDPNYLYPSTNTTRVVPPVLSVQIIQTSTEYTLSQLKNATSTETDRGTVFLVPAKYDAGNASIVNYIPSSTYLKSNDHTTPNTTQKIGCSKNNAHGLSEEFACATAIAITKPVGGTRNPDTFLVVLSLPNEIMNTTVALQVCTDNDSTPGDCMSNGNPSIAELDGVQISVDSTGRANDMYVRVESRIEFPDLNYPFPEYAVEATSTEDDAVKKNFSVTDNCIVTEDGVATPCENYMEH